jgi:hypothetical protein
MMRELGGSACDLPLSFGSTHQEYALGDDEFCSSYDENEHDDQNARTDVHDIVEHENGVDNDSDSRKQLQKKQTRTKQSRQKRQQKQKERRRKNRRCPTTGLPIPPYDGRPREDNIYLVFNKDRGVYYPAKVLGNAPTPMSGHVSTTSAAVSTTATTASTYSENSASKAGEHGVNGSITESAPTGSNSSDSSTEKTEEEFVLVEFLSKFNHTLFTAPNYEHFSTCTILHRLLLVL